ncbi:Uncharacterized conserved protein, DUF885 familyt [Streptomyces zhaozhouensis]|uniref:Uncharacterized conserved protein, DUF885 familyt n=1 Tax=Streptomyces zhaozhouensis TaxID=1300267 RepID=A0A286DYY1_9ACTN|nr:DUF885 domain-containing protein [Streptomyces zhaozhouensis]SOD63830.1 Uncharacterized conserved protein, DUF885 familyt [Streptomyces zhaozhouensis]
MRTPSPRAVADAHVETMADLNPAVGSALGIRPGDTALPDYSPDGLEALADARRVTLGRLTEAEKAHEATGAPLPAVERRAARLLRERLTAELDAHEAGEGLRQVSNLFSPVSQLRSTLLQTPRETPDDWAAFAARLRNVPRSLAGYTESLDAGVARGLLAAPRQARVMAEQLGELLAADWFRTLVAEGPEPLGEELTRAADTAAEALERLRRHLTDTYLPAAEGTPDAVGRARYLLGARTWTGAALDVEDAYAYGWSEFHRVGAEMRAVAAQVLPGESTLAATRHLEEHGEIVEGVEAIRDWLQGLMDRAITELDGAHFDLAEPVRRVESMIAPPGSAAAPYYTRPTLDFSRPGRTWLPTRGATRFPTWQLVSIWYHEGVPGHHLQLAQWVHVADQLSAFQATLGSVSATTEGWALYAERLMDELGHLADPAHRLGYLSAQMMRSVRVIVDIGMHLGLRVPDGESFHPGERWTPELATEFFRRHTGFDASFTESEIVRYLGMPGQAITYKLGERAWLAGREAARRRAGSAFDARRWHMAALSLGSLGLDDLEQELAAL